MKMAEAQGEREYLKNTTLGHVKLPVAYLKKENEEKNEERSWEGSKDIAT